MMCKARNNRLYDNFSVVAAICKCGYTGATVPKLPYNQIVDGVERDWDCGVCGGPVFLLLREPARMVVL